MARTVITADYFEASSALVTGQPFTINSWIIPTGSNSDGQIFSVADNGSDDNWYKLSFHGSSGSNQRIDFGVQATGKNPQGASTPNGSVTAGIWHMASAVERAVNSRSAYVNGVIGSTSGFTREPDGINTTSVGRVGRATPIQSESVGTYVAEIAVWNIGLSDAEIALLHNAGPLAYAPFFVRPEALVHYWRCLEDSITADLVDIVGGLNLTQTSSPAVADHVPVLYPAPRTIWSPSAVSIPETVLLPGSIPMFNSPIFNRNYQRIFN